MTIDTHIRTYVTSIGYADTFYNVHVMYHALDHTFFMVSITFVSCADPLPGMVEFQDAPSTSGQVINGSSNKMSIPFTNANQKILTVK